MGNQPSSEAFTSKAAESQFQQYQQFVSAHHADTNSRPLPPPPALPRPLASSQTLPAQHRNLSDRLDKSDKSDKPEFRRSSTLTSGTANRLTKPRMRARSNTGLLQPPAAVSSTARFSTASFASLVSSFGNKEPPANDSSVSLAYPATTAASPSVYTFEEAVALNALNALNAKKAASTKGRKSRGKADTDLWLPSELDQELLQEQQLRQHEFERRTRHNQSRMPRQNRLSKQQFSPESVSVPAPVPVSLTDDADDVDDADDRLARRSFFRSRSMMRMAKQPDLKTTEGRRELPRRNSIASVYDQQLEHQERFSYDRYAQHTASSQYNNQYNNSQYNYNQYGSARASWCYDMNSYAARRIFVDDQAPSPYEIGSHTGHGDRTDRTEYTEHSSATSSRRSVVSEATWKSAHPALPDSPPQPLSRTVSDPALFAPMRRASMMNIPGMATRGVPSQVQHQPAGKPDLEPDLDDADDDYDDECLTMPAVQRLRPSRLFDDAARASTPTDDNVRYSAIGAFKLGSLRITNGAESPTSPDVKRSPQSAKVDTACARSMALAALSANETPVELKGNVLLGPLLLPPAGLSPSAEPTKLGEASDDYFGQPLDLGRALDAPAAQIELPQVGLPDDLFEGFEFSSFSFEDTVTVPVSPEEDGGSTVGYTGAEVLDVRLDPSAKAEASAKVARSDSGYMPSPTSQRSHWSQRSHKPLSKADSGYSSNVSLRSFRQAASKLMAPVTKLAVATDTSVPATPPPQRLSFSHTPSPELMAADKALAKKLPPPPPPIDTRVVRPSSQSSPSASPLSTSGTGSGMQRPNKLRRFLTFSNQAADQKPPAVHVTHVGGDVGYDAEASVPDLPNGIHARYPTTKRLPLPLRPQKSRDTLKTIFSVGSLEARTSNGDLYASGRSDSPASLGRISMRTAKTNRADKRKSRLSMAVDFAEAEAEAEAAAAAAAAIEPPPAQAYRSKTLTSATLQKALPREPIEAVPRVAETKTKNRKSRLSLRRRDKDDAAHAGAGVPGVPAAPKSSEGRTNSLMSRTMSLGATIERTLSLRLSFSRSRPAEADTGAVKHQQPTEACSRAWTNHADELQKNAMAAAGDARPARPSRSSAANKWAVQTDHHAPSPTTTAFALASANSRAYTGPCVPRRSFTPDISAMTDTPQTVRYRASYDGFGHQATKASKPPSAHVRNRSLGGRATAPANADSQQYRVLHSYNSPAYRGAPIWG